MSESSDVPTPVLQFGSLTEEDLELERPPGRPPAVITSSTLQVGRVSTGPPSITSSDAVPSLAKRLLDATKRFEDDGLITNSNWQGEFQVHFESPINDQSCPPIAYNDSGRMEFHIKVFSSREDAMDFCSLMTWCKDQRISLPTFIISIPQIPDRFFVATKLYCTLGTILDNHSHWLCNSIGRKKIQYSNVYKDVMRNVIEVSNKFTKKGLLCKLDPDCIDVLEDSTVGLTHLRLKFAEVETQNDITVAANIKNFIEVVNKRARLMHEKVSSALEFTDLIDKLGKSPTNLMTVFDLPFFWRIENRTDFICRLCSYLEESNNFSIGNDDLRTCFGPVWQDKFVGDEVLKSFMKADANYRKKNNVSVRPREKSAEQNIQSALDFMRQSYAHFIDTRLQLEGSVKQEVQSRADLYLHYESAFPNHFALLLIQVKTLQIDTEIIQSNSPWEIMQQQEA